MTIDDILDNIGEYRSDIEKLVFHLKNLGINSLDEFKTAARESGVPIPKSIQDAVESKFLSSDDDDWAIAQGKNTIEAYEEYLYAHEDGKYRDAARSAKAELQQKKDKIDSEDAWASVDKTDIESLQSFILNYPDSEHAAEVNKLLRDLKKERYMGVGISALSQQIKDILTGNRYNNPVDAIYKKIVDYLQSGKITKDALIEAIRKDHNFLSSKVVHLLYDNGYITDSDFVQADIDPDFVSYMMRDIQSEAFEEAKPLASVTKVPCTEVYFWGIPSSGKSCALGAILSAANDGKTALSMAKDNNCQGYGYMNRLANLFRTDGSVGCLPEGTPTTSTYEMGFELEDEDHKIHPITCIDLAGELVRCMFKNDANENMLEEQKEVLQTLTSVMVENRTSNRKLHFFVLEYGAEDRMYEGLPQSSYLHAAVEYIKRTGIFKKDTDGIYLLISKVDKAGLKGKALQEHLKEYINNTYAGFYNGLKRICSECEINDGKVEIVPFTLGDVCFQNYCKFKSTTASNVVKLIMSRTYGYRPGRLGKIINSLKK